MNSYRRGLRNGVLLNPKLFILEKVNLVPHTNGWSNLVKRVKNLYYLVRVVTVNPAEMIIDFRFSYFKKAYFKCSGNFLSIKLFELLFSSATFSS